MVLGGGGKEGLHVFGGFFCLWLMAGGLGQWVSIIWGGLRSWI